MRLNPFFYLLGICILAYGITVWGTGCAQIGSPTGGPRDTIPPRLLKASPGLNSLNFKSNKITLSFDEYIEVRDVLENVLVSPLPKLSPVIDYKLKTLTVKLKDSLLPNTTYTINFGNAIRDNNEGNPFKEFTYIFSTGDHIDSLVLTGKVILAETGKADSTLTAMLYRNTNDSAVKKNRPDYLAKLRGDGSFTFTNLSPGIYRIYALKDGDGSKTYNSKTEGFAFADMPVTVSAQVTPVILYAYAEEKDTKGQVVSVLTKASAGAKKLVYSSSVANQGQDLHDELELSFNKPLKKLDTTNIRLTDTGFKTAIPVRFRMDSSRKKIFVAANWQENTPYRLIINAAAVSDSAGNAITKTDTLRFSTKKESDYGNVVLRFSNLDLSKLPVLQFVVGNEVKESYALTTNEWSKKLFKPGEYEIRILFDSNHNGKWDPGNYAKKIQPEKVITIPQKLSIRANWDNERDIKL